MPESPVADDQQIPAGAGDKGTPVRERLIKKYTNRRLYDAAQSRHVTLADLRRLIADGEQIRVIEEKSGEDITRQILVQVILGQEDLGQPLFSIKLMESLIRFYDSALQSFLSTHLERSMELFLQQVQLLGAETQRAASQAPLNLALTDLTRRNMELWLRMQESMLAALDARRDDDRPPTEG